MVWDIFQMVALIGVISLCSHPVTWSRLTHARTFWVQAPHVPGFQGVVGADLDLVLQNRIWETLKEKLVDCHVKSGDDFLQSKQMNRLSNSRRRNM